MEKSSQAIHKAAADLEAAADAELAATEKDLDIAIQKRYAVDHPEKEDENTRQALDVHWRAFAERASVKATGAEHALLRAVDASMNAEKVESAATQARRDTELLARRAGELVAYADALRQGSESLMQRAYEKACQARDACGADPTTFQESTASGRATRMQNIIAQHNIQHSTDQAAKLLEQAREHARAGNVLKKEAAQREQHVQRVLQDATAAKAKEEVALVKAGELAESARRMIDATLAQNWAEVAHDDEFQATAHNMGLDKDS